MKIDKYFHLYGRKDDVVFEEIEKPELRQKGKWIVSHIPDSMLWECNQCGFDCGAHSFNFCPNCGADMRGEKDDQC